MKERERERKPPGTQRATNYHIAVRPRRVTTASAPQARDSFLGKLGGSFMRQLNSQSTREPTFEFAALGLKQRSTRLEFWVSFGHGRQQR